MIKRLIDRFVPRVQVVHLPSPPSVDSLVVGLNRTLASLQEAARAHSAAAERHRDLAREAEQAAVLADAESLRATRVAVKIASIVA